MNGFTDKMKKDLKYYKENAEEDYLTTPISVLRYIGEAEYKINKMGIIIAVLLSLITIFFLGGIVIGQKTKQQEIENRTDKVLKSKQINKECYTKQDLEIIIFNQIQE